MNPDLDSNLRFKDPDPSIQVIPDPTDFRSSTLHSSRVFFRYECKNLSFVDAIMTVWVVTVVRL